MNATPELSPQEVSRIRLGVLRQDHRDLDRTIYDMEGSGPCDQLALRRLKKQKLALKDQISRLENGLIPDIIA